MSALVQLMTVRGPNTRANSSLPEVPLGNGAMEFVISAGFCWNRRWRCAKLIASVVDNNHHRGVGHDSQGGVRMTVPADADFGNRPIRAFDRIS